MTSVLLLLLLLLLPAMHPTLAFLPLPAARGADQGSCKRR
jgi:hypothetical protein